MGYEANNADCREPENNGFGFPVMNGAEETPYKGSHETQAPNAGIQKPKSVLDVEKGKDLTTEIIETGYRGH